MQITPGKDNKRFLGLSGRGGQPSSLRQPLTIQPDARPLRGENGNVGVVERRQCEQLSAALSITYKDVRLETRTTPWRSPPVRVHHLEVLTSLGKIPAVAINLQCHRGSSSQGADRQLRAVVGSPGWTRTSDIL